MSSLLLVWYCLGWVNVACIASYAKRLSLPDVLFGFIAGAAAIPIYLLVLVKVYRGVICIADNITLWKAKD